MSNWLCSSEGCSQVGTHQVVLELYPPDSTGYSGAPALLFFPDLRFCEEHANGLTWDALIYPDAIAGMFERMGRVKPDFNKTGMKLSVIQGAETV